jgi:hypothetical protein
MGLMLVGCVAGIAALVFGIWAIVLLFKLRANFARAAAEARRTWASDFAAQAARHELPGTFPPAGPGQTASGI